MENLQSLPVTGPVTDSERSYAVDSLNATLANLKQSLDGLSTEQLTYKPTVDRWSIAECVEHIALVEKGIYKAILAGMSVPADPAKRADIRISDVDVIKAVRSRLFTLAAPAPFVPTGRFGDASYALQAFEERRQDAIDLVLNTKNDLRTHYFIHPALGTLDTYQAVLVMASHVERHRKQIDEIKASSGFPS
ncbi:DinB family protein [Spirosoma endophyticum]|uniref:DinB superfamily protein n=1 Tax=Spirosoma endophyticum TaxID=662367 RepID=A0A1I1US03_9BACT|nr:DinB family protein [Spirosoma endophyticum]SFD71583.1 DinB superfamily protein [Spirosoma endophyticum]